MAKDIDPVTPDEPSADEGISGNAAAEDITPNDNPPAVTPRWLHICELATAPLALCMVALRAVARVPGQRDGDLEKFDEVSVRLSELVQLQVGERVWGKAIDEAVQMWNEIYAAAREVTIEEGEYTQSGLKID